MTEIQKESKLIFDRLRNESHDYDRPEVRLATINRLVIACDEIESGRATEIIRSSTGFKGRIVEISATNIERYVKARHAAGIKDWTGPTRTFIASDRSLNAYVKARENERLKPPTPKRPSERYKTLEDAIERIREPEKRQLLRFEIEEGRAAKRKLALILNGLRRIPGVDIDLILRPSADANSRLPGPTRAAELDGADREILDQLVTRLLNAAEMQRAGLELDGKRLRMAVAPLTTVIRPVEMELLQRLARRTAAEHAGTA
jgi:hypothetical protein